MRRSRSGQALARATEPADRARVAVFAPWNAPDVIDPGPAAGYVRRRPARMLARELWRWCCTRARPGTGSVDIEDGWCMLDPTNVGILAPGMGTTGRLAPGACPSRSPPTSAGTGCPPRTTDHIVLCLFWVGNPRQVGHPAQRAAAFKRDWDANAPLAAVLPELLAPGKPTAYRERTPVSACGTWARRCGSTCEWPGPGRPCRPRSLAPRSQDHARDAYERLVAGDVGRSVR